MVDFINEVEEELRKDQYNAILRKWGPLIAGVALLVVAGAGVYEYFQSSGERMAKSTSISYVEASKRLESGDESGAQDLFLAISDKAQPGYAGLSLMQAAGIAANNGKPGQAISLFDQASAAFETELHQDLSALKASYLLMDNGEYADVKSRVTPLAQSGRPYEYLARELLGFVALEQGDTAAANSQFAFLARSPDVPENLKARAEQALALTPSVYDVVEIAPPTLETPDIMSEPVSAPTQEDAP